MCHRLVHLQPNDKLHLSRRNRICVYKKKEDQPHIYLLFLLKNGEMVNMCPLTHFQRSTRINHQKILNFLWVKQGERKLKWKTQPNRQATISFNMWDTHTHTYGLMYKDISKAKMRSTVRAPKKNENPQKRERKITKTAFYSYSIGYATQQLLVLLLLLLLIVQNTL